MRRSSTSTIVFGIALLGSMPASFAQTTPANPAQSLAQPGGAAQHESQDEIRSFEQAPVSLAQAIADAGNYSKGHAIEAAFALERGTPLYVIKTYGNGALWEGRIDANTGKLVGQPRNTPEGKLTATQQAQLSRLQSARDTLLQAVATAEQKTGGKAIDAVLATGQGGALNYAVETAKDGAVQVVMVDPQNAQIASVQPARRRGSASSGSSVPPAPTATLPSGASTDKSLGEPPPGSTKQNLPLPK